MGFYSYKLNETLALDTGTYNYLLDSMRRSKARDRLETLQLHIYSKVSQSKAEEIHKNLVKKANPPSVIAKRAVKSEDIRGFDGAKIASIEDAIRAKNG